MPEQVDTSRSVLSTTEAAKIAGFNPTYIQRLLRQERIEGVRVGTVWLVYEDSLKAFIAQPRRRGPKGPHKKKSMQDQANTSLSTRHAEAERTEEETKRAEGKETEANK